MPGRMPRIAPPAIMATVTSSPNFITCPVEKRYGDRIGKPDTNNSGWFTAPQNKCQSDSNDRMQGDCWSYAYKNTDRHSHGNIMGVSLKRFSVGNECTDRIISQETAGCFGFLIIFRRWHFHYISILMLSLVFLSILKP